MGNAIPLEGSNGGLLQIELRTSGGDIHEQQRIGTGNARANGNSRKRIEEVVAEPDRCWCPATGDQ
jgi:hypothetical protein